ncbi:MAG: hypothetical protein F4X59_17060 [Holophagales bacterium]|nr:hypothetical protein [Holophagales bacterium]MYC11816.1 hypothetical protein [Holophagales bacterium]
MKVRRTEFRGRLMSTIKTMAGDVPDIPILGMLVAVLLMVSAPLVAQPPEDDGTTVAVKEKEGETLSRAVKRFATDESITLSYRDGNRVVNLVATDHVLVKSKYGKYQLAELPKNQAGVVTSSSSASLSRNSGRQSEIPVFLSDAGTIQAPVGGVLIHLREDWTDDQVDQFFKEHGLDKAIEPLGWSDRSYMIHTVPGVFAIELADQLAGLHGVKTVEPNFWQPMEGR